jgi:hypothetical protein
LDGEHRKIADNPKTTKASGSQNRTKSGSEAQSIRSNRSSIERLPSEPTWTIFGCWLANLDCPQVRGSSRVSIIHSWNNHARIDSLAASFEPKIQIHGVVHGMAIGWIGWTHFLKDIEIDFDTVFFLSCGLRKIG